MNKNLFYHYRHWRRYQEIINTLIKHGFSFVVDRFELPGAPLYRRLRKRRPPDEELSNLPRRVVELLKALGTTFIKLGQLLSTRGDLLPEDYLVELVKLQDQVAPLPYAKIASVVQTEVGQPVCELFNYFQQDALASASIGQVHRAQLKSGEEVVVKVQRPGIENSIRVDLEICMAIGQFIAQKTRIGVLYKIPELLEEFSFSLLEELDFNLEGKNAEIFQQNFQSDPRIRIPKVYWEFTRSRVLVMEYVEGQKITRREGLLAAGYDPLVIARTLVDVMIKQVYVDGFFHSDPHPGNLAVLPGNKVVLMDFGQVGQIDETLREKAADLVLALVRHDMDAIVRGLLRIGIVRGHPNLTRLKRDLGRLERKYYGMSLKEISLGSSIQEIFEVAWRYQIEVPVDFVMTAKAMITLEGVIRELAPEMSLVEIAEPFASKVLRRRYDPRRMQQRIWQGMVETAGSVAHLPGLLEELASSVKQGDLTLQIEQPQFPVAIGKLRLSLHRLALSIILASLLIAGSLLMKLDSSSILIRFHLPQIVLITALIISFLLMVILLFDSRV